MTDGGVHACDTYCCCYCMCKRLVEHALQRVYTQQASLKEHRHQANASHACCPATSCIFLTHVQPPYLDLLCAVSPSYSFLLQAACQLCCTLQASGSHTGLLLQTGLLSFGCCQGCLQTCYLLLHSLQGSLLLLKLGIGCYQQRFCPSQRYPLWLNHLQQKTTYVKPDTMLHGPQQFLSTWEVIQPLACYQKARDQTGA